MSIYSEYLHGDIDYDEFRQAYNLLERKDEMDDEERCFKEGTGQGDCNKCFYACDCGKLLSEDEEDADE